jgi:hypothetical protein
MEVQDQTRFDSTQSQVGKKLCGVNGKKSLNGLQLQDQATLNNDIRAVAAIESD